MTCCSRGRLAIKLGMVALLISAVLMQGCGSSPPPAAPLNPVQKLNAEGYRRFERGEAEGAEEMFRLALRESELVDDAHGQAESWNNLGALAFARGDAESAFTAHSMGLRLYARSSARVEGEVRARANLGMTLLSLGRDKEAEGQFQTAIQLAGHLRVPGTALLARAGLAAVQLRQGDTRSALQSATQVAHEAKRVKDRQSESDALVVMAEALRAQGSLVEARARLEDALAIDRERHVPYAIAEDLRSLSRVHLAMGARSDAADCMVRCARISRALGQLDAAERELTEAIDLLGESAGAADKTMIELELRAVRLARAERELPVSRNPREATGK